MPSKNLHTLQPGTEMVAAGYCMYGERALFCGLLGHSWALTDGWLKLRATRLTLYRLTLTFSPFLPLPLPAPFRLHGLHDDHHRQRRGGLHAGPHPGWVEGQELGRGSRGLGRVWQGRTRKQLAGNTQLTCTC